MANGISQPNGSLKIASIKGVQILDSRNNPTTLCVMRLSDGKTVTFKVPSGASTGTNEAIELRDGGSRFHGMGVLNAIGNINRIGSEITSCAFNEPRSVTQEEFDNFLNMLDKTDNKSAYGANAILAVSGAFARAKAYASGKELYQIFNPVESTIAMPVPMLNVLNAGRHADSGFEVQETMIVPSGAGSFAEAMEIGTDVWHSLKSMLKSKGYSTGRGDEGGFVNPFTSIRATLDFVAEAINKTAFTYGKQVFIAFDAAFSEIYGKDLVQKDSERVASDLTYHFQGRRYSPEKMASLWQRVLNYKGHYIISLEDALAQDDKKGWQLLTKTSGATTQLVLDDYICTNVNLIRGAISDGIGNASLIKLNQIGTVSETIEAMHSTSHSGRANVISHRSGETEDDFIADLSVHLLATQIKSGSSGSDRNSKYNRLLLIEAETGAKYIGFDAFPESVAAYWKMMAQQ